MINSTSELLVKNIEDTIISRRQTLTALAKGGSRDEAQEQLLGAVNAIDAVLDGYVDLSLITAEQYNHLDDLLDTLADVEF